MATKMTRAERERFFTTLAHATDERAVQAAYETGLLIFLPKGTTLYSLTGDEKIIKGNENWEWEWGGVRGGCRGQDRPDPSVMEALMEGWWA